MERIIILLNISAIICFVVGITILVLKWRSGKKNSGFFWIAFVNAGNALRSAASYLEEGSTLALVAFIVCSIAVMLVLVLEYMKNDD